jgi:hypothetical protein
MEKKGAAADGDRPTVEQRRLPERTVGRRLGGFVELQAIGQGSRRTKKGYVKG